MQLAASYVSALHCGKFSCVAPCFGNTGMKQDTIFFKLPGNLVKRESYSVEACCGNMQRTFYFLTVCIITKKPSAILFAACSGSC